VILTGEPDNAILVSMTSLLDDITLPVNPRTTGRPDYWPLQDAKARFSELVRKAKYEGPQHVTVHGRDEVVVIAAEEFRRLSGNLTGAALIDAIRSSPHREIEIEPARMPVPVCDVTL
jgi:prevent-host-death family protein